MLCAALVSPPMEDQDDQMGVYMVQVMAFLNAVVASSAFLKITFWYN
jgi:hypothetical protein